MFEHLDDPRTLPAPTREEVSRVMGEGARRRRRRQLISVAAPVVALAAIAAAFSVTIPRTDRGLPDPADTGSLAPTASGTPSADSVEPAGPYEMLVARGTTLVAIDAGGRERAVVDVASRGLSADELAFAYVSSAGWLAVQPGAGSRSPGVGHELIDLRHRSASPVLVEGTFDQRTWSPDGTRLATNRSGHIPVVIDAASGRETVVDLHGGYLPGGGPSLIWTSDGTGILVKGPGPGSPLQIAPVDGGELRKDVPRLWERGGRSIIEGGLELAADTCALSAEACPPGVVRVRRPDGDLAFLYTGEIPRSRLAGASLSADGQTAYLLLATATPDELVIATSDARRTPRVLATVRVATTDLAGMSLPPDLSMAAVTTISHPNDPSPTINCYVVPLDGTPARATGGSFAGWEPASAVDAIIAAGKAPQ